MSRLPLGSCLVLVSLISGCGRAGGEWTADSVVRLIDRIDGAKVVSALDLGDPEDVVRGLALSTTQVSLEEADGLRLQSGAACARGMKLSHSPEKVGFARVEGRGSDRCIALGGPGAFVRPFELEGRGPYRIGLDVRADEGATFRVVARQFDRATLAREDIMRAWVGLLSDTNGDNGWELTPQGAAAPSGVRRYGIDLWPRGEDSAILFGVLVTGGTVRVDDIEFLRLTPGRARLTRFDPTFASPWARLVEVGMESRESLVLVAPGEFRFHVTLADEPSRLALSVVGLEGASGEELDFRCHASCGNERVEAKSRWSYRDGSSNWLDLSLDLTPLAGRRVEIVLSAQPAKESAIPSPVAFGCPVIEPIAALPAERKVAGDVVLISLDTVRADRLSLHGHVRNTSPTLDRLAASSAVFDAAIAPSSWTLPSHVTLFTGQLPDRHGVDSLGGRIDHETAQPLAAAFRERGYQTVAVTGGGFVHPEFGFQSGFERYGNADPVFAHASQLPESYTGPKRCAREGLLSLLREPRSRPLFLFVHTYVAHEYIAGDEDLLAIGVASEQIKAVRALPNWKILRDALDRGERGEDLTRHRDAYRMLYDAGVRLADDLVGDVVSALTETGRLESTLLIVTSDHGEELGDHGQLGHRHDVHEELVRSPLLFRGPGIEPGRIDRAVSLADLAPTVRELCGLPPADSAVDGRSLLNLLRGVDLVPEPVLSRSPLRGGGMRHALRTERWKLILEQRDGGATSIWLYDLAADPHEQRDLSDERPELAGRLSEILSTRVSALQRGRTTGSDNRPTQGLLDELRRLGYLGDR